MAKLELPAVSTVGYSKDLKNTQSKRISPREMDMKKKAQCQTSCFGRKVSIQLH